MKTFSADMKMLWHGFSFVSYIGLAMLVFTIFLIYVPSLWWSGFHPITAINISFGLIVVNPIRCMASAALTGYYLRAPRVFIQSARPFLFPILSFILVLPFFTLKTDYSYGLETFCLVVALLGCFAYTLLSKKLASSASVLLILLGLNLGKVINYLDDHQVFYFYILLLLIFLNIILIFNVRQFMTAPEPTIRWLYPSILESNDDQDIRSRRSSLIQKKKPLMAIALYLKRIGSGKVSQPFLLTEKEWYLSQSIGPVYFPLSYKSRVYLFIVTPLISSILFFISMRLLSSLDVKTILTETISVVFVFITINLIRKTTSRQQIYFIHTLPQLSTGQEQWALLSRLIIKGYLYVIIFPIIIISVIDLFINSYNLFLIDTIVITGCFCVIMLLIELLSYTNTLKPVFLSWIKVAISTFFGTFLATIFQHGLTQGPLFYGAVLTFIILLCLYRYIFKYVSKRPHPWLLN